eukprot:765231-Hanusia_phi.AAC.3
MESTGRLSCRRANYRILGSHSCRMLSPGVNDMIVTEYGSDGVAMPCSPRRAAANSTRETPANALGGYFNLMSGMLTCLVS